MPIEKPIGLVNKKTGKLWAGENYGEQSQESYDKLFVEGKLNPVQQGIDRFGNYLTTSAQADPIVGPVLNFLGAGVRTITNVLPEPIKQGAGFVLEKNQEAAENIAAATGLPVSLTDPMTIADVVTGGAVAATRPAVKTAVRETLEGATTIGRNLPPPGPQLVPVGAGATPSVQLNVSKGKANLNLAPQVMEAVTLKNPKILKPLGLETGDEIVDAAQAKFNTKRLQKIEQAASKELAAKEAIQNLKDTYGKKPSKAENELVYRMFSRAEGALGRAKENLSRAQSNVFADKDVYFRSTPSKKAKAVEIINRRTYRKIPNNVSIQIDEHHGFPKGMSAALFDRMDQFIAKGIAEPDDLLVMARHAERKGALAGDYKSNMINLVKKPHDELHNYLKNSGDELSKKQWIDVARKAKTPDDLLIIFDDLLDRNVIPNLETAKIWQPLSDLIEDIQKAP